MKLAICSKYNYFMAAGFFILTGTPVVAANASDSSKQSQDNNNASVTYDAKSSPANKSDEIIVTAHKAENDKVLLTADNVEGSKDDNFIIASGHVVARHQGRKITADRLTYNRTTAVVTATGNVVMTLPDGTVSYGNEIITDEKLTSGNVSDFAARLNGGGVIAAKAAVKGANQINVLSNTIYSACPVCQEKPTPTWQIRARNAVQNQKTKMISYRDVVFEIKGVPIIYTPYFIHADPTAGRRSGFLMPRPGHSGRIGYSFKVPYYWAIDNYSDLVIEPQLNQFVNPILYANYRRFFYSGKLNLEGSITKEKLFRKAVGTIGPEKFGDSTWRGHVFGDGNFKINKVWRWGAGVETAADDFYLYRYLIPGQYEQRGPVFTVGPRLLNQLYLEGSDSNFYTRILGVHYQDLTGTAARVVAPFVLPDVEIDKTLEILGGQLRSKTAAAYLKRKDSQTNSARVSQSLSWRKQFILPVGIVATPELYGRSSYYSFSNLPNTLPGTSSDTKVALSNGLANIDFRLPMVKSTNIGLITLEPRLAISTATKNNSDKLLKIEDAIGLENDVQRYFMPYASDVFDAWDGGSKITFGGNLGVSNGAKYGANLFLGKEFRTTPDLSTDPLSNYDKKNGDWAANLNLNYGQLLNLSADTRINSSGKLMRFNGNATVSYKKFWGNFRYYKTQETNSVLHPVNNEFVTSATYTLNKNVKLFVDDWYSIENKRHWSSRVGAILSDDCTELRIYYQQLNTTTRFIQPSRSIKFEVAFKTLGALNDRPFKPLGY